MVLEKPLASFTQYFPHADDLARHFHLLAVRNRMHVYHVDSSAYTPKLPDPWSSDQC